ncbi:MAG: hypothetical protein E6Q94_03605 [Burkholderiaceae bacterium]|jgi:hypothetical protein|nr:MAG: hypothetical protein E6Q94_03605 [Burkholderiaceae bacterium]
MQLLLVVSGDYGELGGAMYFLQGVDANISAHVLLPTALRHAVSSTATMRVDHYDSLCDIEACVEQLAPDVVMLFSGYLLTIGKRFSFFNAVALLRRLKRRGVPVLTSDPFLGLLDSPNALDFNAVLSQGRLSWRQRLLSQRLAWRLYFLKVQLRWCWHVYPSPIQRLHADRPGALSYAALPPAKSMAVELAAGPPSWIFVLSQVDCQIQMRQGGEGFVSTLVQRLLECVALGRKAVLVAPSFLLSAVRDKLSLATEVELIGDEGYAAFMGRLMHAEYAFFWNYYSFSIIHRVRANRPVMFFDVGHMVHIMPKLHDAGVQLFYDAWRPPLLPLEQPFKDADLAQRADESVAQFERINQGLQRCASPTALLVQVRLANQGDVLNTQT